MENKIESYNEIYSYLESSLPISELEKLKNVFIIKNLYQELFQSDLFPPEELRSLNKTLSDLFTKYKNEMFDLKEFSIEMERSLHKFLEKNGKGKFLVQLHLFLQQILPQNMENQQLLQEKITNIKTLLKNPNLSEFDLMRLIKSLEKVEKTFEQHLNYSQTEFLENLEKMIESYKVS